MFPKNWLITITRKFLVTVKSVLSDFSPTLPTRRRPAHVQIEKYNDEMWWQLVSLRKHVSFWNNTWHVRLVRGNFCDTFPSPAVGVLLVRNNTFQLRFLSTLHLQTKNKSIGLKRHPCAIHYICTLNVWRILSQVNLIHGKLNISLLGWLMARPPPAAPSKRLHLLNLSFKKFRFSSKDIFWRAFYTYLPQKLAHDFDN